MITPDFLLRISGPSSSHRWLGFPPSATAICGGPVRGQSRAFAVAIKLQEGPANEPADR